jgi:DNA replication initiation complex subunit (GINS family)
MITYNDIYESARKERYSESLQKIPKSFVNDVASYLKEKKEIAAKDNGDISETSIKTKKQLENAMTLFNELILRRRKKILNLVLIATETGISKADFDNMLQLEKDLFEELMQCMEDAGKKLSRALFGSEEKNEIQNDLVLFLDEVSEFVGMNGEMMGGYSQGDIANIPKEIAKILIEDGKAEKIEK